MKLAAQIARLLFWVSLESVAQQRASDSVTALDRHASLCSIKVQFDEFDDVDRYYESVRLDAALRTPFQSAIEVCFSNARNSAKANLRDPNNLIRKLRLWQARSPGSILRRLVEIDATLDEIRGMESENRPWAEIDAAIRKARADLESVEAQHRDLAYLDPNWHVLRIRAAKYDGVSKAVMERIISDAAQWVPWARTTQREAVRSGEDDQRYQWIERFARKIAEATKPRWGLIQYALVYKDAARHIYTNFPSIAFEEGHVNWRDLNQGFVEWGQNYPHGDWLRRYPINTHANFACLAKDINTTARLIQQIESEKVFDENAWSLGPYSDRFWRRSYEFCKRWALSNGATS